MFTTVSAGLQARRKSWSGRRFSRRSIPSTTSQTAAPWWLRIWTPIRWTDSFWREMLFRVAERRRAEPCDLPCKSSCPTRRKSTEPVYNCALHDRGFMQPCFPIEVNGKKYHKPPVIAKNNHLRFNRFDDGKYFYSDNSDENRNIGSGCRYSKWYFHWKIPVGSCLPTGMLYKICCPTPKNDCSL